MFVTNKILIFLKYMLIKKKKKKKNFDHKKCIC